jgi:predicted DNA-binding transcriptional regulator AlpA
MGRRLLPFHELRDYGVLYSRRHIYRLEEEGKFPKRVYQGRLVAWYEDEILQWVAENTLLGKGLDQKEEGPAEPGPEKEDCDCH